MVICLDGIIDVCVVEIDEMGEEDEEAAAATAAAMHDDIEAV